MDFFHIYHCCQPFGISRNTYKASAYIHKNRLAQTGRFVYFLYLLDQCVAETEVKHELLICIDLEGIP
jgi:hypothetical protein